MTHPYDDDVEPLTAAQAQEAEADGDYIAIPADGVPIRIRPQRKWRLSAMKALNAGDFDGWAAGVMHPDDVDTFLDLDLTIGDFEAFAEQAAEQTGDSLGKSRRPSRSSKSRRKR